MMDEALQNPYLNDDLTLAPFAGRQAAFSRFYQHLTAPSESRVAMLFVGRRHIGKTTFLRRFDAVMDESFIGVYISLKDTPVNYESGWLMTLAHASAEALGQRDFTLSRLSEPPIAEDALRDWLAETRLSEVCTIIRPYRRLVILLDDAESLIDAIVANKLPMDTFVYLQSLLEKHPQLGIALTLDTGREAHLEALSPLVSPASVFRLDNLTLAETTQLLREPVTGLYAVSDEAVNAVQTATGGAPLLLQRYGFLLYHHWQHNPQNATINEEVAKSLASNVYIEVEEEFKAAWHSLERDERLVLTAIVSLLYDDPLRKIDTAAIQAWLLETDYPVDTIAINSAIRGLEYGETIKESPSGITVNASLMQRWLVENARLSDVPSNPANTRRTRLWLAALALILLLALLVALALSIPRSGSDPATSQPTVTLQEP
jgi:hypothetical protein